METAATMEAIADNVATALSSPVARTNQFGGWDFEPISTSKREGYGTRLPATSVRISPVDGDFDYGTNIYVLTRNEIVLASVELRAGNASPALIAAVARDLWSVR